MSCNLKVNQYIILLYLIFNKKQMKLLLAMLWLCMLLWSVFTIVFTCGWFKYATLWVRITAAVFAALTLYSFLVNVT